MTSSVERHVDGSVQLLKARNALDAPTSLVHEDHGFSEKGGVPLLWNPLTFGVGQTVSQVRVSMTLRSF